MSREFFGRRDEQLRLGVRPLTSEGHGCSRVERLGEWVERLGERVERLGELVERLGERVERVFWGGQSR